MNYLTADEAKEIYYDRIHGIAYSHVSTDLYNRLIKAGLIEIMYRIIAPGSTKFVQYPYDYLSFPEEVAEELRKLGYRVGFFWEEVLGRNVKYLGVYW